MLPRPRRLPRLLVVFALIGASCAQLADLPTLERQDLSFKPAQSSKIYAADGTLITTLHGEQDRTVISLDRIPRELRQAVIAIEDERFYDHDGVDFQAIARAFLTNVASGEILEGGSTITQQYVKNVIISPGKIAEKTFARKLQEAALSRQLERQLTKNEILERYLNTVYFGEGAYGIQAAAKTYFGVAAAQLDLPQAATLAALIRSPETYDPFKNRKAARARRDLVIAKMEQLGYITEAEALEASSKKIKLQPVEAKDEYEAAYFLDYVQRLLTYDGTRFSAIGETVAQRTKALFQGGLRIYTTVDLEMQDAAEAAVAQVLTYESDPHASLVAIEPETGHVRAMVGGRDWFAPRKKDPFGKLNLAIASEPGLGRVKIAGTKNQFENEAPGTGRQAGSAFKPFALVEAIDQGTPLSKTYPAQACMDFAGANGGANWHVCNYADSSFGSQMSLLEATVNSVNVVYAQLILEVGAEAVVEVADAMGINTDQLAVNSAVLGANEVNPLGMASAYGTLATNGVHHPPVAITKIVNATGKTIYEDETEAEQVIEPPVAYLATTALEQVVLRGTGTGAQIGRPAAGKTGTAQDYRDAWFVGYTPDLVAAVWVGYPEGQIEMKVACATSDTSVCRPTRLTVTGGSWPASIWQIFMLRALQNVPASSFEEPAAGFVTVTIDTRNGCLASELTPNEFRAQGTFAEGTAPEETCVEPEDKRKIRVPNVFGFPEADAIRILQGDGFNVSRIEQPSSTYPPGRVIGQDPTGGTPAQRGSTVVITVSVVGDPDDEAEPPPEDGGDDAGDDEEGTTVPSVLGYTRAEAEQTLHGAGFDVAIIIQRESSPGQAKRNRGRVWKQSPPSGTRARRGSTVTIWINPS